MIFGGETSGGMMSDLWTIDTKSLQANLLPLSGEAPSARTGSRAVLVGNAYIVFGGSSFNVAKKEDATLYLLNTVTKAWSIARIQGVKPSARIGHSLSLIGSKIFVFGGRPSSKEETFANDLWAFDINTLFAADAAWELIPTQEHAPQARSGHSAVTWLGRLCKDLSLSMRL